MFIIFVRKQKTVVIDFRMIPVEHNPFLSLFADRGEQPLSENMLNIRLLKQGPHFPRMLEK